MVEVHKLNVLIAQVECSKLDVRWAEVECSKLEVLLAQAVKSTVLRWDVRWSPVESYLERLETHIVHIVMF